MTDYTLPPVPDHPEPRHMRWSGLERKATSDYGHACAEAARAPLLARIAELEQNCAEIYEFAGALQAERDRLRAEVDESDSMLDLYWRRMPESSRERVREEAGSWVNPLAAEVEALQSQLAAERADAEWKLTADGLPEDGRLVLFEVGENNGSFAYLNGQIFGCRFSAAAARHSTGFWTPGLSVCASRWRYVDPPTAIDAARAEVGKGVGCA